MSEEENLKEPTQRVEDVSNEPKSIYSIFQEQIDAGLAEHKRTSPGLFLSALAAGLEVGFTLFLVGILYTQYHGELSEATLHFILAIAYPVGFVFVIIGQSELFTEHTTLAVIPVLQGKSTFLNLLRVWGLIYAGNLLGGYLMAYILTRIGPHMEIISAETFNVLAQKMTHYSGLVTFGSAMLAGWLMGQLSWLVTSSQDTMSRIFIVFLITGLIGIGGLHHSIVGSVEVFAGVIMGGITPVEYLKFQGWTTLGNIVGGVVFVSLIKFSVIRLSSRNRAHKDQLEHKSDDQEEKTDK